MENKLPLSRIRTIMKSSSDTGQISNEVLYAVTKATELFVKHLSKQAYEIAQRNANVLQYRHLADVVQSHDSFEFLLQTIPPKMLVKDLRVLMAQTDDDSNDASSDENNSIK